MEAQLRQVHDPVRSDEREMVVFRKINTTKKGGRVGFESTDFDFLLNKNVTNSLDHASTFTCKWLSIVAYIFK